MRILSQSEFQSLNAETQIPVDLAQQYFPVQLRAFSRQNGEKVSDSYHEVETKHLKEIIERSAHYVDAERVSRVDRVTKDGYTYREDVVSEHSWDTFEFGVGGRQNRAVTLVRMFPVSHLVLSDTLAAQEIEQRPGYVYFAAEVNKINDWGAENFRGSSIYGHENFANWRHRLEAAQRDDAYTLKRLEEKREIEKAQQPKKRGRPKKQKEKVEPIEFERAVDEIEPWKGAVEDLAHCTNSRVVKQLRVDDGYHYILESPLEFPRGFVRETAMLLKRDWSATSKLVDEFCRLCFEKPGVLPDKGNETDHAAFPCGEPDLKGPDVWWRYSENPWLVQTILLARLIGGDFWQYALSNLEESSPDLGAIDL